jgi:acetyl esterase/lipase
VEYRISPARRARRGYPGTFADIGVAIDTLRGLATRYPLDLTRVTAVGHSAGGHLALWAAARPKLPADSAVRTSDPLPLGFVVTLAGINDLAAYHERGPACGGGRTIDALIDAQGRGAAAYADTSPRVLLPLGVEQLVVSGDEDGNVPTPFGRDYAKAAIEAGDKATVLNLAGADHFALINPASPGWATVRERLLAWAFARK